MAEGESSASRPHLGLEKCKPNSSQCKLTTRNSHASPCATLPVAKCESHTCIVCPLALHAFLGCSEALKAIGRKKFALVMTSFFDDFTVITQKCHARHVSAVVSNFFSRLGWQVAAEPKKNVDFSEVFDVLGVRVDLSRQCQGVVSVQNKPSRAAELGKLLSDAMDRGSISPDEAHSLRGRLVFAEQQVWGRNTRMAVVLVGDVPGEGPEQVPLSDVQLDAMEFLLARVVHGKPRSVTLQTRPRYHLFIDGACEWEPPRTYPQRGMGAVLIPWSGVAETWGCQVDKAVAVQWTARAQKQQLVFECDLLPYFLSLQLWADKLKDSDLFVWIDN